MKAVGSHHSSLEGEIVNSSLEICNSLPGFLQLVIEGAVIVRLGLGKRTPWDGSCRGIGLASKMLLQGCLGSCCATLLASYRELEILQ